jgi:hypothetical protein
MMSIITYTFIVVPTSSRYFREGEEVVLEKTAVAVASLQKVSFILSVYIQTPHLNHHS